MRIGINAYPLTAPFAGIGTYIYRILKYLEKIDNDNEYFLYCHKNMKLPFPFNSHWHIRIIKGFLNISSVFWMQTQAKKELIKDKIDLFWSTNAILPLRLPNIIKTVLTVYDLTWVYYPGMIKWDNKIIFPLFFKKSVGRADRIIAISETTAKGVKNFINGIDKKVSIVYPGGAGEQFEPSDKIQAKNYISSKFNTSLKYILAVTTIEPRKNLDNLLRSYAILIRDNPNFDYQLLIAGGKGWQNSTIYNTYKELKLRENQVKFLGYISSDDLNKIYSGAEVLVFPSFYEGFGLPPLEAMACGTPVVASDIPVFKEILNGAALLTDPHNPEEIADGIYRVLSDKTLAEELSQKGFERIKLFSWEKTAREILKVFEQLRNDL